MATTSNVNLPLTKEEWRDLKHFLAVYERGYVPAHILDLANRVKTTPDGKAVLRLQERWLWILSQRNQT